jgi:excisionase family DNA binding protein
MTTRLALSVEEAAGLLGISRALAYELVNRGELPAVRLGRRIVVPRVGLEALLAGAGSATATASPSTDGADQEPDGAGPRTSHKPRSPVRNAHKRSVVRTLERPDSAAGG